MLIRARYEFGSIPIEIAVSPSVPILRVWWADRLPPTRELRATHGVIHVMRASVP
jgi:hypothetical protein